MQAELGRLNTAASEEVNLFFKDIFMMPTVYVYIKMGILHGEIFVKSLNRRSSFPSVFFYYYNRVLSPVFWGVSLTRFINRKKIL